MNQPPSVKTVGSVVAVAILLTAIHFTDNAINIDDYPPASWQPEWFEFVVVGGWLLGAAIGILGYRKYRDGDYRRAHLLLGAYSTVGFVSLGHFTTASPSDLTNFGLATVMIDVVVGLMVLGVVVWSVRRPRVP
ncbi:MAG: hypothetical protein WAP35_06410 [Solirubrobacterales bacterium]